MPRAPHKSALLAGRPSAKRSVFSIRMSRIRSIPLSSPNSTRLTRGTGVSRPFGCHTKASAFWKDSGAEMAGALAERCAAIVSSARTTLAWVSSLADEVGRFDATFAGFREAGLALAPDTAFLGFFDMSEVPDRAAFIGPLERPQAGTKEGGGQRC